LNSRFAHHAIWRIYTSEYALLNPWRLSAGTTGLKRPSIRLRAFRADARPPGNPKKARRPLRNLLYGAKPHVYRVIYEIDEPRRVVRVLTIRHGAMDEAGADDLSRGEVVT
jgi:mRNA-degrading endonuclease RelE of RelBE toxin-antitoxin system